MTKYESPGPWRVERPNSRVTKYWIVSPGGNVIAVVYDLDDAYAIVDRRNAELSGS